MVFRDDLWMLTSCIVSIIFKLDIEFIQRVEETKCSAFWGDLIERLTNTETLVINYREHRKHWHPVLIWIRLINHLRQHFCPFKHPPLPMLTPLQKHCLKNEKAPDTPNIPSLRDMPLSTGSTHRIALLHGYLVRFRRSACQILSTWLCPFLSNCSFIDTFWTDHVFGWIELGDFGVSKNRYQYFGAPFNSDQHHAFHYHVFKILLVRQTL